MSRPTVGDMVKLKRILRYLKGHPRKALIYEWQNASKRLPTYVDSDWVGRARTWRSASGGVVLRGARFIQHWSWIELDVKKKVSLLSGSEWIWT